jgi:hypothetical protein
MALDITQMISEIRTSHDWIQTARRIAPYLQQLQDAVNQSAQAAGVDATQHSEPPSPPAKLNVKAAGTGELAHFTVEDNSPRGRALHNFLEISTSSSFSPASTYTRELGPGRHHVESLPTFLDDGSTKQTYYARCYTMEPGSKKSSEHIYHGQAGAPTGFQMNGSTALTLMPSTGCGTAPSNGQKAGVGFGASQFSDETFKK